MKNIWGGIFDFLEKDRYRGGPGSKKHGGRDKGETLGYKTTLQSPWEMKAREHQKKLETKSGVPWSRWHGGDGWKFAPKISRETPLSEEHANTLEPYLTKEQRGFLQLAMASKMPLSHVLSGAITLVRQKRALHDINRMGDIVVIRKP